MVDPIMLFVTQIYQAIIPSPAVRMNDAVRVDSSVNNSLQRGFSAIRNNLDVNLSVPFKNTKNGSFFVSATAPFTFNSFAAEIGFIYFDLFLNWRLLLTKFGDTFSNKEQITINCISI